VLWAKTVVERAVRRTKAKIGRTIGGSCISANIRERIEENTEKKEERDEDYLKKRLYLCTSTKESR
jgi:hypothetical protein